MPKICDWSQNRPLIENPRFLPHSHETWVIYSTHELVLFTKFHSNRVKIVDFLLMVYFDPSCKFFFISLYTDFISTMADVVFTVLCPDYTQKSKTYLDLILYTCSTWFQARVFLVPISGLISYKSSIRDFQK